MPNGLTGGFKMQRAEFESLLGGFDQHAEVGRSLASLRDSTATGTPPVNLTVAGALAILRESHRSEVWFEEHDYTSYIMCFEPYPHPDKWVIVDSTSPLFAPLRQRHRR